MSTPIAAEPKRYCTKCGARLHRKRYGGRLEDMAVFRRRKFCDRTCMAEAMLKPDVTRGAHLWRARRHKKSACEKCGAGEAPRATKRGLKGRLHVHHIDRDWRNDDPSNLLTLCDSCHLKRHWAEDDRRTSIRKRRTVKAVALERLYTFADALGPSLSPADALTLRSIVKELRGSKD